MIISGVGVKAASSQELRVLSFLYRAGLTPLAKYGTQGQHVHLYYISSKGFPYGGNIALNRWFDLTTPLCR